MRWADMAANRLSIVCIRMKVDFSALRDGFHVLHWPVRSFK